MNHDSNSICPSCQQNCSWVALVDLIYTFEVCNCNSEDWPHLVKTAWHKKCYLAEAQLALSETRRVFGDDWRAGLKQWEEATGGCQQEKV